MNIFKKISKKNKSNKSWIHNHQNDFYVRKAKENNYRSRAAYKLLEIDTKYHVIKTNQKVLDVGCAPGGWCQVLKNKGNHVWGVDILSMKHLDGVNFHQMDISANDGLDFANYYRNLVGDNGFDLIVSDAACNTTGHPETDHFRTSAINSLVIDHLRTLLKTQGHWAFKTFNGSDTPSIIKNLKTQFTRVQTFKPLSSKSQSKEIYVVCLGFKNLKVANSLPEAPAKALEENDDKINED
jgi:23S rRNA (uridine2552-2'-O)-methyltransferase